MCVCFCIGEWTGERAKAWRGSAARCCGNDCSIEGNFMFIVDVISGVQLQVKPCSIARLKIRQRLKNNRKYKKT